MAPRIKLSSLEGVSLSEDMRDTMAHAPFHLVTIADVPEKKNFSPLRNSLEFFSISPTWGNFNRTFYFRLLDFSFAKVTVLWRDADGKRSTVLP